VGHKQGIREGAAEKDSFAQESPIDCPLEQELSAKVESPANVLSALTFDDERECWRKLYERNQ
jgi:hypothetical protein